MHRRDALVGVPFVAAAAIEAAVGWRYDPATPPRPRAPGDGHHRRRRRVRLSVDQFVDLDRRHGSGGARPRLARGMPAPAGRPHVAPHLHRRGRPWLFVDAATLRGQLAFMCYTPVTSEWPSASSSPAPATGHSRRRSALRRAPAGGHRHPGRVLGPGPNRLQLARAAIDGAGRAPPAVLARLYTAEASAHAVTSDKTSSARRASRAERAVAHTSPSNRPAPASYFTPAHCAGTHCAATAASDCTPRPCGSADAALDLHPSGASHRVLRTALIATTHAAAGYLDAAAEHGLRALDQAEHVQSRRVPSPPRRPRPPARPPSHPPPAPAAYLERVQALPKPA